MVALEKKIRCGLAVLMTMILGSQAAGEQFYSHMYVVGDIPNNVDLNAADAYVAALKQGGQLVTVSSDKEFNYISNTIAASYTNAWIGLSDRPPGVGGGFEVDCFPKPEQWDGLKEGLVCGPCAALVFTRGGTCREFCGRQNLECENGWDDNRGGGCSLFNPKYGCDHKWNETVDAVCDCKEPLEPVKFRWNSMPQREIAGMLMGTNNAYMINGDGLKRYEMGYSSVSAGPGRYPVYGDGLSRDIVWKPNEPDDDRSSDSAFGEDCVLLRKQNSKGQWNDIACEYGQRKISTPNAQLYESIIEYNDADEISVSINENDITRRFVPEITTVYDENQLFGHRFRIKIDRLFHQYDLIFSVSTYMGEKLTLSEISCGYDEIPNSPIGKRLASKKVQSLFAFVHDGNCNENALITYQDTWDVNVCAKECQTNPTCVFFSYNSLVKSLSMYGSSCTPGNGLYSSYMLVGDVALGTVNTNSCTDLEVPSAQVCESLALANGKRFDGVVNYQDTPKGCSSLYGSYKFNTHTTGGISDDELNIYPVCMSVTKTKKLYKEITFAGIRSTAPCAYYLTVHQDDGPESFWYYGICSASFSVKDFSDSGVLDGENLSRRHSQCKEYGQCTCNLHSQGSPIVNNYFVVADNPDANIETELIYFIGCSNTRFRRDPAWAGYCSNGEVASLSVTTLSECKARCDGTSGCQRVAYCPQGALFDLDSTGGCNGVHENKCRLYSQNSCGEANDSGGNNAIIEHTGYFTYKKVTLTSPIANIVEQGNSNNRFDLDDRFMWCLATAIFDGGEIFSGGTQFPRLKGSVRVQVPTFQAPVLTTRPEKGAGRLISFDAFLPGLNTRRLFRVKVGGNVMLFDAYVEYATKRAGNQIFMKLNEPFSASADDFSVTQAALASHTEPLSSYTIGMRVAKSSQTSEYSNNRGYLSSQKAWYFTVSSGQEDVVTVLLKAAAYHGSYRFVLGESDETTLVEGDSRGIQFNVPASDQTYQRASIYSSAAILYKSPVPFTLHVEVLRGTNGLKWGGSDGPPPRLSFQHCTGGFAHHYMSSSTYTCNEYTDTDNATQIEYFDDGTTIERISVRLVPYVTAWGVQSTDFIFFEPHFDELVERRDSLGVITLDSPEILTVHANSQRCQTEGNCNRLTIIGKWFSEEQLVYVGETSDVVEPNKQCTNVDVFSLGTRLSCLLPPGSGLNQRITIRPKARVADPRFLSPMPVFETVTAYLYDYAAPTIESMTILFNTDGSPHTQTTTISGQNFKVHETSVFVEDVDNNWVQAFSDCVDIEPTVGFCAEQEQIDQCSARVDGTNTDTYCAKACQVCQPASATKVRYNMVPGFGSNKLIKVVVNGQCAVSGGNGVINPVFESNGFCSNFNLLSNDKSFEECSQHILSESTCSGTHFMTKGRRCACATDDCSSKFPSTPGTLEWSIYRIPIGFTGTCTVKQPKISFGYAAPTISNISPSTITQSDTDITITGTNFYYEDFHHYVTSVTIGGQPCTKIVWVIDHTKIVCTPSTSQAFGNKKVTVTVDLLNSNDFYISVAGPTTLRIANINPNTFPTDGGVQISLTGNNLGVAEQELEVNFPGPLATQTIVVNSWSNIGAELQLPAGHGGATVYFKADSTKSVALDYDIPVIEQVTVHSNGAPSQSSAPQLNGVTVMQLEGKNFGPLSHKSEIRVWVGADEIDVDSLGVDTIRFKFPSGTGERSVKVSVATRVSEGFSVSYATPIITRLEPLYPKTKSDAVITLIGQHFGSQSGLVAVYFNGKECTIDSLIYGTSESKILFRQPEGSGVATIKVIIGETTDNLVSEDYITAYADPVINGHSTKSGFSTEGGVLVLTGENFGTKEALPVVTLSRTGRNEINCNINGNQQLLMTHSKIECTLPSGTGADWSINVELPSTSIVTATTKFAYPSPSSPEVVDTVDSLMPTSTGNTDNPQYNNGGQVIVQCASAPCNFGTDKARVIVHVGLKTVQPYDLSISKLKFIAPPGTGTDLQFFVTVDDQSSVRSTISYAPPRIASVSCGENLGAGCDGKPSNFCAVGKTCFYNECRNSVTFDFEAIGVASGCSSQGPLIVTIYGHNFGCKTGAGCVSNNAVTIDGNECKNPSITIETPEKIVCTLDGGGEGFDLEVEVTIDSQSSGLVPALSFAGPVITSVEFLNQVSSAKDTIVRLTGTNFGSGNPDIVFGPIEMKEAYKCITTKVQTNELRCKFETHVGGKHLGFSLTNEAGLSTSAFNRPILDMPDPELISWRGNATQVLQNPLPGSKDADELVTLEAKHVGVLSEYLMVTLTEFNCITNCDLVVSAEAAKSDVSLSSSTLVSFYTPRGKSATNYKISITVWPEDMLSKAMSDDGTLRFTYPKVPVVSNVTGCPTKGCPTSSLDENGVYIRLKIAVTLNILAKSYATENAFRESVEVFVGDERCGYVDPEPKNYPATPPSGDMWDISCQLPVGTGYDVPVTVSLYEKASSGEFTLDYAEPEVVGVWKNYTSGTEALRMDRTAQEDITITGSNFGRNKAVVLVGGASCGNVEHDSVSPHTMLTCKLPQGEGNGKPVIVVTDGLFSGAEPGTMSYQPCPMGTRLSEVGNTTCLPCEVGKFASSEGSLVCTACSPGYYADATNKINCDECEAGTYSNDVTGAQICTVCQTGKISVSKAFECTDCQSGKFGQTGITADLHVECQPCSSGKYQPSTGSTSCIECQPGTYTQRTQSFACLDCKGGEYQSSSGQSSCVDCLAGNAVAIVYAVGNTDCPSCALGRATNSQRQSFCPECNPGTFANATGLETCHQCPPGRFQEDKEGTSCSTCNVGYYARDFGQTQCDLCPLGKQCPNDEMTEPIECLPGTKSTESRLTCEICIAGEYSDSAAEDCLQCGPGTVSATGSENCTDCSTGKFQDDVGKSICKDCDDGEFVQGVGQKGCGQCSPGRSTQGIYPKTRCGPCQAGSSTDGNAGQGNCTLCEAGKYALSDASPQCTVCDVGHYNTGLNNTGCEECSAGSFQGTKGESTCIVCDAGKYSGSNKSTVCDECDTGSYQDQTSSTTCKSCEAGRANKDVGQEECKPCGLGKATNSLGQIHCTSCNPGFYADNPASLICTQCQAGTAFANQNAANCNLCPVGKATSALGQTVCPACPPGRLANVSGSTECYDCAPGKYSAHSGTVWNGVQDCTSCARGFYVDYPGANSCIKCHTGDYSNIRGAVLCKVCLAGTFSVNSEEGTRACTTCAAGTFSKMIRSAECTDCVGGKYQNDSAQDECKDADQGHNVLGTRQESQTTCKKGTFQDSTGQSTCLLCESGSFGDEEMATNCTLCSPGKAQQHIGRTTCDLCGAGRYAAIGQKDCEKCEQGTVVLAPGAAECVPCPNNAQTNKDLTECMCSVGFASQVVAGAVSSATNSRGEVIVCKACPEGGDCTVPGTNWLNMKALYGWWEAGNKNFYRCLRDEHCAGGICSNIVLQNQVAKGLAVLGLADSKVNLTTTTCCAESRKGTLCALLETGYTLDYDGKPMKCGTQESNMTYLVLLCIFALLGVLLLYYIILRAGRDLIEADKHEQVQREKLAKGFVVDNDHILVAKRLRHRLEYDVFGGPSLKPNSTFKIKIFLSFMQILISMATSLEIRWPSQLSDFLQAFNIFKFDFFNGAQVACLYDYTYFDQVYIIATVPAVILVLVVAMYVIPSYFIAMRKDVDSEVERTAVRQQFWKLTYYSLFILYPVVSSAVMRVYVCKEVESVHYLVQDFNILCTSDLWIEAALINIIFVLVYPIGIPLYFLFRLHKFRHRLTETGVRASLGILYDGYDRSLWFFEMVEMLQKMALTCLIVFLEQDSQMAGAMIVVGSYLVLILVGKPYLRKGDDRLACLAQVELLVIFSCAHINRFIQWTDAMELTVGVACIFMVIFFVGAFMASGGRAVWKSFAKSKAGQQFIPWGKQLAIVRKLNLMRASKDGEKEKGRAAKYELFDGIDVKLKLDPTSNKFATVASVDRDLVEQKRNPLTTTGIKHSITPRDSSTDDMQMGMTNPLASMRIGGASVDYGDTSDLFDNGDSFQMPDEPARDKKLGTHLRTQTAGRGSAFGGLPNRR